MDDAVIDKIELQKLRRDQQIPDPFNSLETTLYATHLDKSKSKYKD